MSKQTRIDKRFAALRAEGRAGLVTFLTAGDPDPATSASILDQLPAAGADLIELGMPFSDPMADGPAIQLSSQRALKAGMSVQKTLDMVADFRQTDNDTPVILMGYFNPVHAYGVDRFVKTAATAGVDGLIIVDLPPEEEADLCLPAKAAGLNFIFLTAPTTDEKRLPRVLANASGFVYYVSITGITGTASADASAIEDAVSRLRRFTALPIAVGFGITTPDQAADVAAVADAAVVGSALVNLLAGNLDADGNAKPALKDAVLEMVRDLARGVAAGRSKERLV